MFRIFALALLFVTTTVHAQDWSLVTDSSDGTRLLVDVDTVQVDKYNKGKSEGTRIHAVMSYLDNSQEYLFTAIIDAHECLEKKSGVLVNVNSKGKSNTYFWSEKGNKMYDAQGQWLCGFLIGSIDAAQKKKQSAPAVPENYF